MKKVTDRVFFALEAPDPVEDGVGSGGFVAQVVRVVGAVVPVHAVQLIHLMQEYIFRSKKKKRQEI